VNTDIAPIPTGDDAPPFLRSWRRIYATVIINLLLLILLFFLFSRAFE
jgi:hypothetical protein